MHMAQVKSESPPLPTDPLDAKTICRCGHCRVMVDLSEGQRRVQCPACGRMNATPRRVYAACARCRHKQQVRFSQRDGHCLCINCGQALNLREVELVPLRRNPHRGPNSQRRSAQRKSAVFTLLLYALALLVVLLWFSQR